MNDEEIWVRCKGCGEPVQLKYNNLIRVGCLVCGHSINVCSSYIDLNPLFRFYPKEPIVGEKEYEELKKRYKREIVENKNGKIEFRKEWLNKVGGIENE